MAVVPVRAGLVHVESVGGLAAMDAFETRARHAVHVRRQEHAVPMDRGRVPVNRAFRQSVGTRRVTVVPFAQRRVGPGSEPLTVTAAWFGLCKSTGVSPMTRSKSVPVSTLGIATPTQGQGWFWP